MATLKVRKADITIPEITAMVEQAEQQTFSLRQRMESDFELATLKEFEAGEDYPSYTSNMPATYLEKVVSWLVQAHLLIRFQYGKKPLSERERGDAGEKFLYGILRANDERLMQLIVPPLRDQLARFISARGMYACRHLLVKDEDGSTQVDITPWDPLHTYWATGRRGLAWACYKTRKTALEVEEEYDMVVNGQGQDDTVEVLDWYNNDLNAVVIDKMWAKEPEEHGAGKIPVSIGAAGHMPLVHRWMAQGTQDTIVHFGESLFKADRGLYDKHNEIMSTMLYLVQLSKRRAYSYMSRDGTKTLDSNPFLEAAQVPLAEGEKVEPFDLLEMSRDTGAFLGLVGGEMQRGSLPHSVFGELAFQLSGYAINNLRQGIDSVVAPRLRALENAYLQICSSMLDQYVTGAFESLELSGRGRNRAWFSETITPEQLADIGIPEIRLVANLPQDEASRFQIASLARQGPFPLFHDRYIYDQILEVEDADLIANGIKEQLGERMLPTAGLYTIMQALESMGRPDLAQLYYGELFRLTMLQQQAQGINPGQGGTSGNGFGPETLPRAAQGAPPPQPTPQAGPNVEPGRPRPGAQGQPR